MTQQQRSPQMKMIGLMGGMGWQGSAAYYRIMNREVELRLGGFHCARIVLDSLDFHPIASAKSKQDYQDVGVLLMESALRLQTAGASQIVIACNTVHRLVEPIVSALQIPLLHIADTAGAALRADGHERIGLLGTRATMGAAFYKRRLQQRYGLEIVVPGQEACAAVDQLIATTLARGREPQSAAPALDAITKQLAQEGCTAILLACTEFGLAFGASDQPILNRELPLYDSGVIHALAAVEFALAPST